MYSKEELSAIIEEYIHALPFPEEPDTLYEPIVYSLGKGGKRLRPLLAMMACNIFSDDVACALPCAAAVEVSTTSRCCTTTSWTMLPSAAANLPYTANGVSTAPSFRAMP